MADSGLLSLCIHLGAAPRTPPYNRGSRSNLKSLTACSVLARPAAILVTPSKYVRGSRLLIRQRHIEILRLIEHAVRVTLWGKRQGSYPSCWNFHMPTISQHRGSGAFNSAVGNTQCGFVSFSGDNSHLLNFSCSSKTPSCWLLTESCSITSSKAVCHCCR